jgi:hypothetical protein
MRGHLRCKPSSTGRFRVFPRLRFRNPTSLSRSPLTGKPTSRSISASCPPAHTPRPSAW